MNQTRSRDLLPKSERGILVTLESESNSPDPLRDCPAVVETLCDAFDESDPPCERRWRDRYPWTETLVAWVIDEPQRSFDAREITIETIDISRTGFGFVYCQFIHPGAMIRTRFHTLPGSPILDGIIAHCDNVGDSIHRTGVQFTGQYP